jgi:hydrocephalus-inducing protein
MAGFAVLRTWLPLFQVIEMDPEPAHSVVEENYRELRIQFSANVDFASYQCETTEVFFKETLVYQTRVFE